MHPTNCLNCGAGLVTAQKHCSVCGQKAATHRLNWHELIHDALHYVTHADKGIFHLVKELALRPGLVAREYLAGKRVKYFKPVNFFLIVAGILVFMTSYFHFGNKKNVERLEAYAATLEDPAAQKKYYAMAKRMEKTDHYTSKYSNVINMLATPLMAFFFWLFYRKAGYSLIEHLVANMYFVSFLMLFYSLLIIPWQSSITWSPLSWFLVTAFFLLEIIYKSIAYYQFINKKGAGPYFKALGVSIVTVLIWVGGSFLLIRHYISGGFE